LITEAVEADNRFYNSSLAKVKKDNEELKQATIQKDSEIEKINTLVNNLQGQNNDKDKQISALSSAKQNLEANLQKHRSDLENLRKREEAAKASASQAEQINQWYKDRDSLNAELERLEADLAPLELLRHKSFKNYSPSLWFVFGLLMFLIFISTVVLVCLNTVATWTISLASVAVAIGIFCLNRYHTLKERTEVRAEQAYKNWEAKNENKKYNLLKEQISSKRERLKEINVKLKQI
jgi:peptidoglycan hydrolase CwlO-like protein